jgi:hypothetical protein
MKTYGQVFYIFVGLTVGIVALLNARVSAGADAVVPNAPESKAAISNAITAFTKNAVPVKDAAPSKIEGLYVGTWQTTTSKKLHGTANCQVKQIADEQWQGRFWGTWEHVDFDYSVTFCGDPVTGIATIDGADYQWTGTLTQEAFKIQFTGSRYEGSMDLLRIDGSATVVASKMPTDKSELVK